MIVARKSRVLNALIYRLLILSAVKKGFHAVYYRQGTPAPVRGDTPVILYANHSAWWDAHMAMVFNEQIWRREGYVMVEDIQLERYPFFRYLGAFSVNRSDARKAVTSVRYAANVLKNRPNRLLLIFPQGEIRSNDVRPLGFYRGVAAIAREAAPCTAYPLALRYEFIGEQKPEVFISIGLPVRIDSALPSARELTVILEENLTAELDRLCDDVKMRHFSGLTPLVKGSWSINRLWDAIRGRQQINSLGPD